MSCSSYDLPYDVRYDASLTQLTSLPPVRRRLAALAVRAHRLVAGLDTAPSMWRPSQRLLDALDGAFPGGRPGPLMQYLLCEPDHPDWGNQIDQINSDFEELSAADRELVIEFTRMLRELGGKHRFLTREPEGDQD